MKVSLFHKILNELKTNKKPLQLLNRLLGPEAIRIDEE